jgi:hypothetical protein
MADVGQRWLTKGGAYAATPGRRLPLTDRDRVKLRAAFEEFEEGDEVTWRGKSRISSVALASRCVLASLGPARIFRDRLMWASFDDRLPRLIGESVEGGTG